MSVEVGRRELAPGFTISRVLTGLWQIADMERNGRVLDLEAAADAMAPYVEAGFTTFDMADHYGSAEEIAGIYRRRHGGEGVELLTKWVPKLGPMTRWDVLAAVQRALDRLQTDRIDLLQFHAWDYENPAYLDCLGWLQEFKEEGLIRELGLTNFDTEHLAQVLEHGIDVVSNQVCYSVVDQRPRAPIARYCLQRGIQLLAYGTLAGGFATDRWVGAPAPAGRDSETWSRMKYRRFIDAAGGWDGFQIVLRALAEAARVHGVSVANAACRTVLDRPAVGGIIIGARLGRSEHIAENLRLCELELSESSRKSIDSALACLRPIPGDCGDEYRKPPFLTASGDLSHHLDEG